MTHQIPFPEFRHTDPTTSKFGVDPAKRKKDVKFFTTLVAANGYRTVAELAYKAIGRIPVNEYGTLDIDDFSRLYRICDKASKRLSDAHRLGWIRADHTRTEKCTITGRPATRWVVTEKGMDAILWRKPKES